MPVLIAAYDGDDLAKYTSVHRHNVDGENLLHTILSKSTQKSTT